MKGATLDLKQIAERAEATIRAAGRPDTVFLHDTDRSLLLSSISQGRGPVETLMLVDVIRALDAALQAVLPYAQACARERCEMAEAHEDMARRVSADTPQGVAVQNRALEARLDASRASSALADAKAEVESLERGVRPATNFDVWKSPSGWWTVCEVYRDTLGVSHVDFHGRWAHPDTARAARRACLTGKPLPPSDVPEQ